MYDISLINKKKSNILPRVSDNDKIIVLARVLIVLLLLSVSGVFGGLYFVIESSNKKIAHFESEMTKFSEVTKVKENIAGYNAKIKNIAEVIQATTGNSVINTKLLREIAAVMPDDTFLTNYTVENIGEVKLIGKSKNNDNVAYFSQKLKEISFFSNVIVRSISSSTKQDGNAEESNNEFDFDILIKMKN